MQQLFIGVVENRIDPLKTGRVQVRIVGQHTSIKEILPTKDLPYAFVLDTVLLTEGDYCVGVYLDGEERQVPCILGRLPGIPDTLLSPLQAFADPRTESELAGAPRSPQRLTTTTGGTPVQITEQARASRNPLRLNEPTVSRIARNEGIEETAIQSKRNSTFKSIPTAKSGTYDEPESPYAARYPYNHVLETESGHVIEIDDTPGSERIHVYHRSGSFEEYHPDGSVVKKTHADLFEIVLADRNMYINGDLNLTSKRNLTLKAGGDLNIEVSGSINMKCDQALKQQAGTGIVQFTPSPFLLQGLPLSLNGGTPPPLGAPTGPIVLSGSSTTVVAPIVQPNPTDPGNITLQQRAGANLGDKKANELAPQSATPQGIAVPLEANVTAVPVLTTTEGADVMIRALNRAGITDPVQRAMIYAQAAHESNNFKVLVESFKYTDKGLLKTWPSRFTANNVSQYVRNPEKIANFVYANRMGNGDEASGDGWKYRGRGFIQITGKENYIQASKSLNQDFVNYPDSAAAPDTSADIAIWYFKNGKKTGYRGSYSDIVAATKFVNGGTNGLEDRTKKFELAQANTSVTTFNSALV